MRKKPSRSRIADWYDLDDRFTCMRCGERNVQTECAHLVDYASTARAGVADDISNYVLLCARCHADMPNFDTDEYFAACLWVSCPHDFDYFHVLANYGIDRLGWMATDDVDLGKVKRLVDPADVLSRLCPASGGAR